MDHNIEKMSQNELQEYLKIMDEQNKIFAPILFKQCKSINHYDKLRCQNEALKNQHYCKNHNTEFYYERNYKL